MTPEERKAYQEYLDDFDPTPQYGGDDYDYPMSEDAWLETQEDSYCLTKSECDTKNHFIRSGN